MSALPDPFKTLSGEIRKMKEQLRRLSNASAFTGTGMHPNAFGGIESDNYVSGISGYSFNADGNAEFNTITLRAGSVSSTALTNPSVSGVAGVEVTNFAVSTISAEVAGVNLVVPEGCTKLAISATGHVYAENLTVNDDALWAFVRVESVAGQSLGVSLVAAGLATASCSLATSIAGLTPLSTVRLGLWAGSSVNTLATNVNHTATLASTLTWRP